MQKSAVLFLLVFISSCLNQQIFMLDRPVPEHIDFVREKLQTHIETEEELLSAVALLSRELNRQRLADGEAETFFTTILNKLREKVAMQLADVITLRNYNTLLTYVQGALDSEIFQSYELLQGASLGEELFAQAEGMRALDMPTLALHYISRSLEMLGRDWFLEREMSLESSLWYISIAADYHNRGILELMLDATEGNHVLDEKTMITFANHRAYIAQDWDAQVAIGASVTVWVDLGIRFTNRIAFPERSLGTGFYVAPEGYIITNYHVIASEVDPEYEGKSELFIRPSHNPSLRIPAKVIGYDRIFDIALIKAETDAPEVVSFASSSNLVAGSRLYVVGSPGGLENSVSAGIVSASGRRLLQMGDSLQVDVPVNPGNSGGPMFDTRGQLVGVVFAGVEQFEGVNFAIPASWIQFFFPQLFEPGPTEHPWLGLALRASRDGLVVIYVAPGSPAEQAGFQEDEIITAINGEQVTSIPAAQALLLSEGLERLYDISVKAEEELHRLVYSDIRPYSPLKEIVKDKLANVWLPPLFGMKVATAGEELNYNIVEIFPGSIADEAGLSESDSFRVINWFVEPVEDVVVLQISIQRRNSGYRTEGLQFQSYIELSSFL